MKIYGMIGQSNGVGRAPVEPEETNPNLLIYGYDRVWRTACEPSHLTSGCTDANFLGHTVGYSSLMTFGKERLLLEPPGTQIGLVPTARNGTCLVEWLPNVSRTTLYGVFVARMREAVVSGPGEIAGVIIYQGESDAFPALALAKPDDWAKNFRLIVDALRHDLNSPFLPIVYTQIGLTTRTDATDWTKMREIQSVVNDSAIPGVKWVRAKTCPLLEDGIHLNAEGQRMLGKMYAAAF